MHVVACGTFAPTRRLTSRPTAASLHPVNKLRALLKPKTVILGAVAALAIGTALLMSLFETGGQPEALASAPPAYIVSPATAASASPSASPSATPSALPTPAPAVTTYRAPNPPPPPPPPAPTSEGPKYVTGTRTPGAYCKGTEHYWYGYSVNGVLLRCTPDPGGSPWRWRAA